MIEWNEWMIEWVEWVEWMRMNENERIEWDKNELFLKRQKYDFIKIIL